MKGFKFRLDLSMGVTVALLSLLLGAVPAQAEERPRPRDVSKPIINNCCRPFSSLAN